MIYFTSDTHFECPRLVENTRPIFGGDTAWHDKALIEQINETVGRTDILIIAGDFCKTHPGKFRQQINCKHIRYVFGNHDKPVKWTNVFGPCSDLLRVKVPDNTAYVSHYPMIVWNRSHYGTYHFYGHRHAAGEAEWDKLFPQRRSMDVGVDNAYRLLGYYRPFSWPELQEILAGREGYGIIKPEDKWDRRDYNETT